MRMMTDRELSGWAARKGIRNWFNDDAIRDEHFSRDLALPCEARKALWLSRVIQDLLTPWKFCIFCVSEWGIWESSENMHLYYRLRGSYGDSGQLEMASNHLFEAHESDDVIDFLQIALISGWGFYLVTDPGEVQVKVSHDGWMRLRSEVVSNVLRLEGKLALAGLLPYSE